MRNWPWTVASFHYSAGLWKLPSHDCCSSSSWSQQWSFVLCNLLQQQLHVLWACVFLHKTCVSYMAVQQHVHSFIQGSIYLSIYLLGRNDFVYSNVGNLNRLESAALQFVGFCFHHNNKIADSLFAICSLQGFLIVLSQTSSNHLGWSLQDANHKVQHVVAGCFVSPLRMLSLSS